jgi:signal peptide peptidase SppA
VTPLDAIRSRQPWLITPEALDHFAARTTAFATGQLFQDDPPTHPLLSIEDGVGIVSLDGPLIRRPGLIESWLFGAVDTEDAIGAIREAVKNEKVDAILLDIDSPGGTVNGTPELAEAVADASREKFVYAFSGGLMCSAAYWVASQCDAIYASPSARIGSVGVIIPFLDSAEAYRQAGLHMEVFASGKFKSIGTPGTSLTDEQRELLQGEVEEIFADFRTAVLTRGRKIPDEAMEGQTFSARQAQRHNLAGMAKNRDAVLARLRRLHSAKVDTVARSIPHAIMKTVEDQLSEALARIETFEAEAGERDHELKQLSGQLEEAKASLEAKEAELTTATQEHETALADLNRQFEDERAQGREQLAGARTEIDQLTQQVTGLTEANADLAAREQDIEKRAALRAAQIAAESGSRTPAHVTPAGDDQPDQAPKSAAAVWNRQFQPAR